MEVHEVKASFVFALLIQTKPSYSSVRMDAHLYRGQCFGLSHFAEYRPRSKKARLAKC